MSKNNPILSLIIPTYNEASNIPILIEELKKVLANLSHEIIVVDDNSPDKTWDLAEEIAGTYPAMQVIRRIDEYGLSSAVMTGMAVARGQVLAVMDADLQHDERILPKMVEAIVEDGYDVSVGSRAADGGSYGAWSKRRRFVSFVAATMARVLLPVNLSDPMAGFFAVSRKTYRDHVDEINPRGFKILLEFVGRTAGLKIKEVGYTFRNRVHGETKMSASVIRNYLVALYDLRFGKVVPFTFLLYSFVGTFGVLVNLVGFKVGEMLGMPHIKTGLGASFDPLYTAVPFGFQLAIFSNYFMNNYLTFYEKRHRGLQNIKGIVIFQVISLFGLFIQTGIFQFLHNNGLFQGMMDESVRELLNNAIGIIFALVGNYYLNLNFTWGKRDRD